MINTYSYSKDKNVMLSQHFSVGEFRSHANNVLTTDVIKIDLELVNKLEELMQKVGAVKGVITSGYRDSVCDRKVGGSGKGQHVEGKAVDIIFYKADNTTIDTKYISCIAQDLGFKGIARINDRAIHLDNRTNGRYLGDEKKSTNTVTNDFYLYYNIKRDCEIKKDVPSDYAKIAWTKATQKGLVDGTSLQNNLTREQLVVILDRLKLL